MKKRLFRMIIVGFCFAIPMGFLGSYVAKAGSVYDLPAEGECQDCHQMIQYQWGESAHADATSDTVFLTAWDAAGNSIECMACHTTGFDEEDGTWKTDGVSCSMCHQSDPGNHPDQMMETNISSRLCATCHVDTHAEWETSVHGQENLSCIGCHDPHGGQLKAASSQELCSSCHSDEVHFYSYTKHADQGLLCVDCHVSVTGQTMGDGHGSRSHTFEVSLDACSTCHVEELHSYVVKPDTQIPAKAGMSLPVDGTHVTATPEPANPLGYALLSALFGMAFGMILSPWLERWYRKSGYQSNEIE